MMLYDPVRYKKNRIYITDTPFSYTNWASGEPSNSPFESDCMDMWDVRGYQWDDVQCSGSGGIYTACMATCKNAACSG